MNLKNGVTVGPQHPQIKDLRLASYATIGLLQQLNASANPARDQENIEQNYRNRSLMNLRDHVSTSVYQLWQAFEHW